MGDLLKMLSTQGFDFMHQAPLAELQIPTSSVFPAIVAIQMEKIDEKVRDAIFKYKLEASAAIDSKIKQEFAPGKETKSEKSSGHMQRPEHQEVSKADTETRTYSLVYYNPETRNAEIVEENVSISYEDETEQVIEESLAQRSAQNSYEMVATPIIREHIDEQLLKEIMDKIKIESPAPFGGGAAVVVNYSGLSPKLLEEYGDKIIAIEVAEKRKLSLEEKLAAQIIQVDSVVKQLESQHAHANVRQVVSALPPLSAARTLALFSKKKRVQKKVILELLLKDHEFLKALKGRFSSMRVQDILNVVLRMKNRD